MQARSLAHLERMGLDDLQRLSAQLGNPEMQAKVEARLSRNGMSKERIEKGKSEMKEYLDLRMKQEKEGKDKLTETEQQRLKDIKESQEFKAYSVEAIKEGWSAEYTQAYTSEYQKKAMTDSRSTETRIARKIEASAGGYGDLQENLIKAEPITPVFTASANPESLEAVSLNKEKNKAPPQLVAQARVSEVSLGVSI